jgi:hypothetical protein
MRESHHDTETRLLGEIRALKAEMRMVKGAMAADDKRLADAAIRVWGDHRWGCDTPDHMADTILELRAAVARLKSERDSFRQMERTRDDEAKRLREALWKYGKHLSDCNTRLDNECSCGLSAAFVESMPMEVKRK